MSHEPTWIHWDPDTYAQQFHGKEITQYRPVKPAGPSTTYRNDYPVPPLHWQHNPPPDRSNRPTPAFEHTTSHRADFIEHPLGNGAAALRPYPAQKFQPKLQSVTTARLDFKIPPLPPRKPAGDKSAFTPSNAPMGTTTMRADYLEWALPQGRTKAANADPKPTKFHNMTTTRNDYVWPKEIAPPRAPDERPAHVVPAFGGTTEYRAAYEAIPLPGGLPADIGVQVASKPYKVGGEGGKFDLFIKQGQPAPCTVAKTYTTAVDQQQSGAIVVVAKRPENQHGVIVGHFMMDGIKPDVIGNPKIEVTLKLANEKTLHVAAYYRNGKKMKQLTFAAKGGPPIRTIAQASEVPT